MLHYVPQHQRARHVYAKVVVSTVEESVRPPRGVRSVVVSISIDARAFVDIVRRVRGGLGDQRGGPLTGGR